MESLRLLLFCVVGFCLSGRAEEFKALLAGFCLSLGAMLGIMRFWGQKHGREDALAAVQLHLGGANAKAVLTV